MSTESTEDRIEAKLDSHIKNHDEDYKRLLWWIIAILIGLVGSMATWFVSYGTIQEKVSRLEIDTKDNITRQELLSTVSLFDEKFRNINEKLDDIKRGLNIK